VGEGGSTTPRAGGVYDAISGVCYRGSWLGDDADGKAIVRDKRSGEVVSYGKDVVVDAETRMSLDGRFQLRGGQDGSNWLAPVPVPSRSTLLTSRAAEGRLDPVDFLDGGLFPLGKVVVVAGLGGQGKGMLIANLVGDLTAGRPALGLEYPPPAPIEALWVGAEDARNDTINPRLMAAGAVLRRVHYLDGVKDEDGKRVAFSLRYVREIEDYLVACPAVRLVVIDPIAGYVARAGAKDYNEGEVRMLLEPLGDLAEKLKVTIVAIKHLNKDEAKTLTSRISGSVAYVDFPRVVLVVAKDPKDEARRVLAVLKWNLNVEQPSSIAWTMEGVSEPDKDKILGSSICRHLDATNKAKLREQLNRLVWSGPVDVGVDDLLKSAVRREGKADTEINRAVEWLSSRLADGPVGSVLCAKEGDHFLGRSWPGSDLSPDKRRPKVLARVKWWRELLKDRFKGESRRAGYNGPYLFKLSHHGWPPPDHVQIEAIKADDTEVPAAPPPESYDAEASLLAWIETWSPLDPVEATVEDGPPTVTFTASTASTAP
jgi:hypothetical protein